MTPGARVAAAIEVLDQINAGTPAERALTAWARASRFAGSKDRAAIRDHVFDVLRTRRSLGDGDGRALMLRLCRREGWDVDALFDGKGHAPSPPTAQERAGLGCDLELSPDAMLDIPAWLWPAWQDSLGAEAARAAEAQQARAALFLRINQRQASTAQAIASLADDAVDAEEHPDVKGCLRVVGGQRRVKNSRAYRHGLVEVQDAASQAAVQMVPMPAQGRLLDFCAGGGGKALAFADLSGSEIWAHDVAPERMRDIPNRAARAGVEITCVAAQGLSNAGTFDVVFCDAPCSGSGTWRRTPDAKWRLTPERLQELQMMQQKVITAAAPMVATRGWLVYATCSVLKSENDHQIAWFLDENRDWEVTLQHHWLPSINNDGFFLTLLKRR